MKKILLTIMISMLILPVNAADLIRIIPVTGKIVMLQFDDGFIKKHGYHESGDVDESFLWPLDTELADDIMMYTISSEDDANYAGGLNPSDIGRKSKGHDFSRKCKDWNEEPWAGAACKNDYASWHFIYLELPQPLVNGKTYTFRFGDLADNLKEYTLTFDPKTTRSEAVHVNQFGYAPGAGQKFAYISQWMGTMGPLTDSDLIGKRFDIYQLDANGQPGNSVYNGNVVLQHEYNRPDNNRSNETPYSNYVVSNVYECDFSDFAQPGEYILSVEGVGCSFPFRINEDAYFEAYYRTMKAVYIERSVIAIPEQYGGKWSRPEWTDRKFVYTNVRTMDLTDESGKNQKQNIFDNFDRTVDLSNLRGFYHDAGDWDGYFSHFRVPRTLMISYELSPENYRDGELDIPESQVEYNGYTDTQIPDMLDEAVWLVDYFKNNVGPTGGIFGSRVHPDISTTGGITPGNYPDFVFRDNCRIEGIPSWEDCCTWIVHGEDPRDSYAFASIAAQYAFNLGIASSINGKDYTAIIDDYLSAAADAYNWAANNTLVGDESVKYFIENRAAAAAWLYKNTGEQAYLDQLKSDLSAKNITASTNNLGESKWAVWAYVTIDKSKAVYTGTFDETMYNDLLAATIKDAKRNVTDAIDNGRSMRMGGDYYQPVWNGQATTPWILAAMVANNIAVANSLPDAQKFLDACFTTSDYFLGGNQMNMVWLSRLGHVSPEQIMHLDSEYDPDHPGFLAGVPPYGPRPRCDWFAPGNPHPYAGDNCYYNNSHDADFALLDGRLYPEYLDNSANLVWPVHELYFDNYGCPPTNEYTIHQTIAPAAGAYGFLTARGGNMEPNNEPTVSISTSASQFEQGEDVTITITAADVDGWVYAVELYQNNRLITRVKGSETSYTWKATGSGNISLHAVASDNMGMETISESLTVEVNAAVNAPSVSLSGISANGLYRKNDPVHIIANATGQNVKVEFYYYNELITEDTEAPFEIDWTPAVEGVSLIRAVAVDDRGLTASASKKMTVTSDCFSLTSPVEEEQFELGENIVIKAMPESCAGEISRVLFYINAEIQMEDLMASPGDGSFGVSFQNAENGRYTVYAIAETDRGNIISDTLHFWVGYPESVKPGQLITGAMVYPNPSNEGFNFSISMSKPEHLQIEIFTVLGRRVAVLDDDPAVAGLRKIRWEADGMKKGVYYYRINAAGTNRNGKLIIN